jgi:ribosomal protein L29
MKTIQMKDIADKTKADLAKLVSDKQEALRIFRFEASGSKSKNVKEGRTIRKDIARILTAMNAKKTD